MRALLIILLTLTVSNLAPSTEAVGKKTIKVAVIDTGYDYKSDWSEHVDQIQDLDGNTLVKPKLCPGEKYHKDFTGLGVQDAVGHGTHMAGIIAKNNKDVDYCLVIIKYIHSGRGDSYSTSAFSYAVDLGVDIINFSSGGFKFYYNEYIQIQRALDKGIKVVTSAGNNGLTVDYVVSRLESKGDSFVPLMLNKLTQQTQSLNENMNVFFPAIYDPRIISIQNIDRRGNFHNTSNRGSAFTGKEIGYDVLSLGLNNTVIFANGTSQAAALRTGKMLKYIKK